MSEPLIPFNGTICDRNDFHNVYPEWPAFWVNVYRDGFGFVRLSREDAKRFASDVRKTLYRIKVIRK